MARMTLSEAIRHAREVAANLNEEAESQVQFERDGVKYVYDGKEYNRCIECADDHTQLADWLEDYRRILETDDPEGVEELDFVQPKKTIPTVITIMSDTPSDDLISRKDVINEIRSICQMSSFKDTKEFVSVILHRIKHMPSALEKPKGDQPCSNPPFGTNIF